MTHPDLTIRAAKSADLDRLVELWRQLHYPHEGFHPNYYRTAAPDVAERAIASYYGGLVTDENEDKTFIVAELDGAVVGYCIASVGTKPPVFLPLRALHVMEVVVDADHRRKGVFAALHERLLSWGRERGATEAQLTVDCLNTAAIAAYERQGYETIHFKMTMDIPDEE